MGSGRKAVIICKNKKPTFLEDLPFSFTVPKRIGIRLMNMLWLHSSNIRATHLIVVTANGFFSVLRGPNRRHRDILAWLAEWNEKLKPQTGSGKKMIRD